MVEALGDARRFFQKHMDGVGESCKETLGSLQSTTQGLIEEGAKSVLVLVVESLMLHSLSVLADEDAKSKARDRAMQRMNEANALVTGQDEVLQITDSDVHPGLLTIARAKLG